MGREAQETLKLTLCQPEFINLQADARIQPCADLFLASGLVCPERVRRCAWRWASDCLCY